jgi:hypothetical protein
MDQRYFRFSGLGKLALSGLAWRVFTASVAVHVLLASQGIAQRNTPAGGTAEARQATASLREIAGDLNVAVSRFQKHLDDAIAQYDRGVPGADGKRIPAADADVARGRTEFAQAAVRKSMTARMLAARGPGYDPLAASDADHIQDLIAEARERIASGEALSRRLLVVSVNDLDSRSQAASRDGHDQLQKARAAAEDAAKKALVALPIEIPEGDSAEEKRDRAWDLLIMDRPAQRERDADLLRHGPGPTPEQTVKQSAEPLATRLEPYRRVCLIHELGYRLALTDSGTEDHEGRHIFYQEEWVQRGMVTVRSRWRVGVDPKTGHHILIKRYRARELQGAIDDLYVSGSDYLWYLEPSKDSAEPSRPQVESALAQLVQAREQVLASAHEFQSAIHAAVLRNEGGLDAGLPDDLRDRLFAIRGHLAGSAPVVAAEEKVEHAIEQAAESVKHLEPLAAWANLETQDRIPPFRIPAPEWATLQERSDQEIASTQAAIREARAVLPPDDRDSDAKFPSLQKDLVVHISTRRSWNHSATEVRLLQELWRLEYRAGGARRVLRTATLISIDSKTGNQKALARDAKSYPAGPGETVEEIFDQYGGQDLPLVASLP